MAICGLWWWLIRVLRRHRMSVSMLIPSHRVLTKCTQWLHAEGWSQGRRRKRSPWEHLFKSLSVELSLQQRLGTGQRTDKLFLRLAKPGKSQGEAESRKTVKRHKTLVAGLQSRGRERMCVYVCVCMFTRDRERERVRERRRGTFRLTGAEITSPDKGRALILLSKHLKQVVNWNKMQLRPDPVQLEIKENKHPRLVVR